MSEAIPSTYRQPRAQDLTEGARRAVLIRRARALRSQGLTWQRAGEVLAVPHATLFQWAARVAELPDHELTAEACAPRHFASGRTSDHGLTDADAQVIRALRAQNNLNWRAGSLPIAIQEAIRRGQLSDATVQLVRSRMEAGLSPLPRSLSRSLRISETTTVALRSPRNAWLDYVSSEGSLMLTVDEATGQQRMVQPGEWWTMDDGSVNLVCCVSGLERPGDKCWEKFKVCIGRFQFLLVVDHRSYFIPGFSFTARPRDSYRAEDLTATMHTVFLEHGVPRAMVLEHGVSAAKLVTHTLQQLGVQIKRAQSPHQKVVEMVFNHLWTRLSYLNGQVGRFRGEEEAMAKVVEACRSGARDPRLLFPSLTDVLTAIRQVIADWNAHRVQSDQYGSWVPAEFWAAESSKWLTRIAPCDGWKFAPVVTDPLTIRGAHVQHSVPLLPGLSTQFSFGADWMAEFHGEKVRLWFNPLAPECEAAVTLAQDVGDRRAGDLLGMAAQFNAFARHTRRAMGYGLDPDIGQAEALAHSRALRRSVQAVRHDGRTAASAVEVRRADGTRASVTIDGTGTPAADTTAPTPEPAVRDAQLVRATESTTPNRTRATPTAPFSRRRLMEDPAILAEAEDTTVSAG